MGFLGSVATLSGNAWLQRRYLLEQLRGSDTLKIKAALSQLSPKHMNKDVLQAIDALSDHKDKSTRLVTARARIRLNVAHFFEWLSKSANAKRLSETQRFLVNPDQKDLYPLLEDSALSWMKMPTQIRAVGVCILSDDAIKRELLASIQDEHVLAWIVQHESSADYKDAALDTISGQKVLEKLAKAIKSSDKKRYQKITQRLKQREKAKVLQQEINSQLSELVKKIEWLQPIQDIDLAEKKYRELQLVWESLKQKAPDCVEHHEAAYFLACETLEQDWENRELDEAMTQTKQVVEEAKTDLLKTLKSAFESCQTAGLEGHADMISNLEEIRQQWQACHRLLADSSLTAALDKQFDGLVIEIENWLQAQTDEAMRA